MFTDCPPGPVERYTSISRSFGSISTSTSSASGRTATVAALVWIAPLALGLGHALHAVRAALVLEAAPRVVALHEERDVAVAAVVGRLARQHLDLEAVALGVVLVHPVEVAGPEVRLLAALGALDLDDHVATLVRVARQQQLLDLGFELGDPRFLLGDLGCGGTPASRRRSRPRAAPGPRRASRPRRVQARQASTTGFSSAWRRPASRRPAGRPTRRCRRGRPRVDPALRRAHRAARTWGSG